MDLTTRAEKLILSLKCAEPKKQELLGLLSSTGVTLDLIIEIDGLITDAEDEYLAKSEEEIEAFKKAYADLRQELAQIAQEEKLQSKNNRKQKDEAEIKILLEKIKSDKN